MQVVTSIESFENALQTPASLFIFSSLKSCQPCRLLKKWVEEDHIPLLQHMYYIDIYHPALSSITDDIFALPTIHLYLGTSKVAEVEGFIKSEIESLLVQLQDVYTQTQAECTPLLNTPTHDPVSIDTIDDVLRQLEVRLSRLD